MVSTHQSLGLIRRDDGDLVCQGNAAVGDGGGDAVRVFLRRGRTFGAGEFYVKYVRHFGDERKSTRQFPTDFLRLLSEPLRLGLLRRVVHGTRVLHGGGGTRSRRRRDQQ